MVLDFPEQSRIKLSRINICPGKCPELDNSSYHVNIIIFDYILFARLCVHDYIFERIHSSARMIMFTVTTHFYTINNFFTVFSCFILVFLLNIFWKKNYYWIGGGVNVPDWTPEKLVTLVFHDPHPQIVSTPTQSLKYFLPNFLNSVKVSLNMSYLKYFFFIRKFF